MKEIYIRDVEGGKEKYEITIDDEKAKELMTKIILHCGELRIKKEEIKHCYIPQENSLSYQNKKYFKDVEFKESGNMGSEWDHYYEYEVPLYNCKYKEYTCPPIVDYIDRLIWGDKKAIDMLFKGDLKSVCIFPTVKEKIKKLQSELSKLTKSYNKKRKKRTEELNQEYQKANEEESGIEEKINNMQQMIEKAKEELEEIDREYEKEKKALSKELQELLGIEDLNTNQEPVNNYLGELLSLIEYQLVDQISTEEIKRVNDFYKKEVTKDLGEAKRQFVIKKS